ncbi:MAG: CDP-alcohol phosphatidyltransferase family protein [Haloarculaceae archaeon]
MIEARADRRGPLVAELSALTSLWVVALLAVALLVSEAVADATVRGSVALMVTLWLGTVGYLLYSLAAPSIAGGSASPWLGVANYLTLVRAGLFCIAGGFVVVPPSGRLVWVPAICYGIGTALDQLDGRVARSVGRETPLGRRLDLAIDTFGFVVAPAVAVAWGQLPVWYLSLSAARYVYRGLTYLRRLRGRPLFERPDSDLGRYLAGGQMAFLTLVLTPIVTPAAAAAVAPLALAPSLGVFLRDYLFVAGHLPTGRDYLPY